MIDRSNGLIYGDVLSIIWLQDVNYALTSRFEAGGKMSLADTESWVDGLLFCGLSD